MDQWGVPDEQALELIGFPGKVGKSGKRPRFRLNTLQVKTLERLLEINHAVQATHGSPGNWLRRRNRSKPMDGRAPITAMIQDGDAGVAGVLQQLTREVLRKSLEKLPNSGGRRS